MSATMTVVLGAAATIGGTPECTPNWDASIGDGGANGSVVSFETYDSGNGEELYATGDFTALDGVSGLNRIARWDGSQWNPLGTGLSSQFSNAMEVFQDNLYVAGYFDSAGGASDSAKIACWDGGAWSGIGAQLSFFTNSLWDLKVWDDGGGEDLYIAGTYTDIGGAPGPDYIARWDGSAFTELSGTIGGNNIALVVLAVEVFQGELYIGGRFTEVDGVSANYIARWDGTQWNPVGAGIQGTQVIDMAVADDGSGPALFVGGDFSQAGGMTASNIAKWDGQSWSTLGSGTDGTVQEIISFDDGSGEKIFVLGGYERAGGVIANNIARWDGSSWSSVGAGTDNNIFGALVFDGRLSLGGSFDLVDGLAANSAIQLLDCGSAGPPSDLTGDGAVNSEDLAILLGSWGPCPAMGSCPADLNGDGSVTSEDLAILLGDWS